MLSLAASALEFLVFHILIRFVDRISRLPRSGVQPEVGRILNENLALKAQIRALVLELQRSRGPKPKVSLRVRAAAVFASLITRSNVTFQRYYLVASRKPLARWSAELRRRAWPWRKKDKGGRPPLDDYICQFIIHYKTENPLWGARRIKDELRRVGIRVSEPTIQKVLREAGFAPRPGRPFDLDRYRSSAKDMMWALDFFFVRTAKGVWLSVLLIIDVHTRELIDLRVAEVWGPTSAWTMRTLADAMFRQHRQPKIIIHDHGTQFYGQFERQLRVADIEQRRTPTALPFTNGVAERSIRGVRFDLLNHVRVRDGEDLQWYLDEYRTYYNGYRPNQGINGQIPAAFSQGIPEAEVVSLAEFKSRRFVRKSFAHGLLNAYEPVDEEPIAA